VIKEIKWIYDNKIIKDKDLVCLVDGEHYPPVTKWTLERLNEQANVKGVVFIGGMEKVKNALKELESSSYKIYMKKNNTGNMMNSILDSINELSPDIVVDLSDEPVLDYKKRFKIASILALNRVTYLGADFIFKPPSFFNILKKPSLGIIGTGKRVGKTAVSINIARLLKKKGFAPVIVAMGRGGPEKPELVDIEKMSFSPQTLIDVSKRGGHAASDYWEDAMLAQVMTIGCRRCGGGMVGNTFASNVIRGAKLANKTNKKFIIMEGSGATLPPIKTDTNIVVAGAGQPPEYITDYFGQYRLLLSELVVLTMCEPPDSNEKKIEKLMIAIKKIKPKIKIATTIFRPEPLGEIKNKKVFVATTAPKAILPKVEHYLEDKYNCEITGISNNLSNRVALRKDLKKGLGSADILLTEIKAASIDVAAMTATEKNVKIVFMHNKPILNGGNISDFNQTIVSLCKRTL